MISLCPHNHENYEVFGTIIVLTKLETVEINGIFQILSALFHVEYFGSCCTKTELVLIWDRHKLFLCVQWVLMVACLFRVE